MPVDVDDPEADWTRTGVFEVAPHVYRIPLPLPHDGLKAVNVYALVEDDGVVLVDSGWSLIAAREALQKALAALGRDLREIRRFLVTHVHRDHYSLAVTLRREFGTTVGLGAGERPTINALNSPEHRPMSAHADLLVRCGAEEIMVQLRERSAGVAHDPADWAPPDEWLAGGTDVVLAQRTLAVVETPGHTQGHVVFVDAAADLLFAGDHVLPHITPSIGFEAVPSDLPLGNFLNSLRLVREMPDRRLLPAHGPVRASTHARVDELLDHHAMRLDEAVKAVGQETLTAFEAAHRLTWTRRRTAFADLDVYNQMLAVTETAAHLDLLVAQHRLAAVHTDRVRRYGPA